MGVKLSNAEFEFDFKSHSDRIWIQIPARIQQKSPGAAFLRSIVPAWNLVPVNFLAMNVINFDPKDLENDELSSKILMDKRYSQLTEPLT